MIKDDMAIELDTVGSTQEYLKSLLQKEALPHLESVLAYEQTHGYGRANRRWEGQRGNLYLSIWLAHFTLPLTWVPHWICVNVVDALISMGVPEKRISIKWPNDILIDKEAKISGILCEKISEGVVVGIGANLISAPLISDRSTTSLKDLVPGLTSDGLNLKMRDRLMALLSSEPTLPALRQKYLQFFALEKGHKLEWIDLQTHQLGSGAFEELGKHGELVVSAEGKYQKLFSEEIKLRNKN